MEGARWDDEKGNINESLPKELSSKIPFIWMKPTSDKPDWEDNLLVNYKFFSNDLLIRYMKFQFIRHLEELELFLQQDILQTLFYLCNFQFQNSIHLTIGSKEELQD